MKKTVYLDTTIPSYLFDRRESIKNYVDVTKKWWKEERPNYHVVVSSETVAETSRGSHPHKEDIVSCVAELDLLPYDKQVNQIVQVYIDNQQ
jgi:hypothetical protein